MQREKTSPVFILLIFWLSQIHLLAADEKQWRCEIFPPEHEITTDEVSGAKVVFVTTDKAHDYGFYFHQEAWLPDGSVLFFRRTTEKGMHLFGYIESTGEIFRVQQPEQLLEGEPTASRHANKLWVAHDGVLAEWMVHVKLTQPTSSVTIREKIIGPLPADAKGLSGINENADGKGVILGYTRETSPRSRIVRMDCATGKIEELDERTNPGRRFDRGGWLGAGWKDRTKFGVNYPDDSDGTYYRGTFEAALTSNPDWLHISTFNELGEYSHIEATFEYGYKYIDITAELVEKFKNQKK